MSALYSGSEKAPDKSKAVNH